MLAMRRRHRTRECGTDAILYDDLAWRFLSRIPGIPSHRWPLLAAHGASSRHALAVWRASLCDEEDLAVLILEWSATRFALPSGVDVEDYVLARASQDALIAIVGGTVCLAWKSAIPPSVRSILWAPFGRWGDA